MAGSHQSNMMSQKYFNKKYMILHFFCVKTQSSSLAHLIFRSQVKAMDIILVM